MYVHICMYVYTILFFIFINWACAQRKTKEKPESVYSYIISPTALSFDYYFLANITRMNR